MNFTVPKAPKVTIPKVSSKGGSIPKTGKMTAGLRIKYGKKTI